MADVDVERHGPVMVITLARPEQGNSLTGGCWLAILEALHEAERDRAVRVIVTRAKGKTFSVGADASDVGQFGQSTLNELFSREFSDWSGRQSGAAVELEPLGIGRWTLAAASIEKPWITAVNGVAAGGGMALSLMSHFRIGSTRAKFAAAFTKLGIGPEMGLSAILPAVVGRQTAMDLLLSSRLVKAQEAHQIGLIDQLVEPDALESETLRLAERIAKYAPLATSATIRACLRSWLHDIRRQLEVEWRDQNTLMKSDDCKEGAAALFRGRAAEFTGS